MHKGFYSWFAFITGLTDSTEANHKPSKRKSNCCWCSDHSARTEQHTEGRGWTETWTQLCSLWICMTRLCKKGDVVSTKWSCICGLRGSLFDMMKSYVEAANVSVSRMSSSALWTFIRRYFSPSSFIKPHFVDPLINTPPSFCLKRHVSLLVGQNVSTASNAFLFGFLSVMCLCC